MSPFREWILLAERRGAAGMREAAARAVEDMPGWGYKGRQPADCFADKVRAVPIEDGLALMVPNDN